MKVIQGKKLVELDAQEFTALCARYDTIWLDIGTGDGLFVYRAALENPRVLCIGLEPAWTNVCETAGRAGRKPAKGGAPNALYAAAAVEAPPPELHGLAARISINYPWGSLLDALVRPIPQVLSCIYSLAGRGAELEVFINRAVFDDERQRLGLGLPLLDSSHLELTLFPAYSGAGFSLIESREFTGEAAQRSSWGAQLTVGSGRETLYMKFRAGTVEIS